MKTKTKWIVTILAVLLIAVTVLGTSTDLFQGRLRVVMSCGDSAGVDGLYSACVGDSIAHETSGITATVTHYNNDVVKLSLAGAETKFIKIGRGEIQNVTSHSNFNVSFTYTERTARHGAFIQIRSYSLSGELSED